MEQPVSKCNFLGNPENWKLVGYEYNLMYNMFVLHTSYNYEKLKNLMGDNKKSIYITIIRDPVDILVSAWYYYRLDNRYFKVRLKFIEFT